MVRSAAKLRVSNHAGPERKGMDAEARASSFETRLSGAPQDED
jgi:hypothetical protein